MLKYCMAGKLVALSPSLADLNHSLENPKLWFTSLGTRLGKYLVTLNWGQESILHTLPGCQSPWKWCTCVVGPTWIQINWGERTRKHADEYMYYTRLLHSLMCTFELWLYYLGWFQWWCVTGCIPTLLCRSTLTPALISFLTIWRWPSLLARINAVNSPSWG